MKHLIPEDWFEWTLVIVLIYTLIVWIGGAIIIAIDVTTGA